MTSFFIETQGDLFSAFTKLKDFIIDNPLPKTKDFFIKCPVKYISPYEFVLETNGVFRFFYQSRQQNKKYFGVAAANKIDVWQDSLLGLDSQEHSILEGQFYFVAKRFSCGSFAKSEWKNFPNQICILPLLLIAKEHEEYFVQINFASTSKINFSYWQDLVLSLLSTNLSERPSQPLVNVTFLKNVAEEKQYFGQLIKKAQGSFCQNNKKVVLGLRRQVLLSSNITFTNLVARFSSLQENSFAFIVDAGKSELFFGLSPELLFSKKDCSFETEALAGTLPKYLGEESTSLLKSSKNLKEHEMVSSFLEELFWKQYRVRLAKRNLQLKELRFVYHLRQKLWAQLPAKISAFELLLSLHPTPAVCGINPKWALQFIQENENFDRGYYAGPLGIIGQNFAEVCVAIRSALSTKKQAFIYAANGIVEESNLEYEWEEIKQKQNSILDIFASGSSK